MILATSAQENIVSFWSGGISWGLDCDEDASDAAHNGIVGWGSDEMAGPSFAFKVRLANKDSRRDNNEPMISNSALPILHLLSFRDLDHESIRICSSFRAIVNWDKKHPWRKLHIFMSNRVSDEPRHVSGCISPRRSFGLFDVVNQLTEPQLVRSRKCQEGRKLPRPHPTSGIGCMPPFNKARPN